MLSNMIVLYRPNVQQSLYLFLHKSSNLSYPQRYLPKYSLLINKCRSKKWAVLILEKPELTHKSKQILMYYWLCSNFLGIHSYLTCVIWSHELTFKPINSTGIFHLSRRQSESSPKPEHSVTFVLLECFGIF